jgi:hypothetical protein
MFSIRPSWPVRWGGAPVPSQLHPTVIAYDAGFVALAEALDVPLVTLDGRLARATGPRCEFLLPS